MIPCREAGDSAASRRRLPPASCFPADGYRSLQMSTFIRAIPSPCTGVCTIDGDGLCMGCHRSIAEITQWTLMDDAERRRLMDDELPRREAQRTT